MPISIEKDRTIQQPREKFTVRGAMLAVACAALVLAILMAFIRTNQSPRIKVTIFNETSGALCDVRIKFMNGKITKIESGGDAGVFLSYHTSNGILGTDEPIYHSLDDGGLDSGFLEVHIDNKGARIVNAIQSRLYWTFSFGLP